MAFDLNKSKEEKTKTKFNLSKTSEPLTKVDDVNSPLPENQNAKSKKSRILLFAFLGILCLAVAVWFILNQAKSPEQKITSNEQATVNHKANSNSNADNSQTVPEPQTQSPPDPQATRKVNDGSVTTVGQTSPTNKQNAGQNASMPSTSATSDVPYMKNKSYKVYLFPFGNSNYSQTNPELEKLANVLRQNPGLKISISAYTDNIGDKDSNRSLSELRAKSIHGYLLSKGIDANRMNFQGMGISTKYKTQAENRRAEFVLSE